MEDERVNGSDQSRGKAAEEEAPSTPNEEPSCANCGQPIQPDDIECPHCGISLVAG